MDTSHSTLLTIFIASGLALACTTTPRVPELGVEESFDGLRRVENSRASAAPATGRFGSKALGSSSDP
jgi:hypothetical protein